MWRLALLAAAIALASPAAAFPRVYFFCMTDDQTPPFVRVGPMAPNQAEARFLYAPDHDGPQRALGRIAPDDPLEGVQPFCP